MTIGEVYIIRDLQPFFGNVKGVGIKTYVYKPRHNNTLIISDTIITIIIIDKNNIQCHIYKRNDFIRYTPTETLNK